MSSRRLTIFAEDTPEEGLEISVSMEKDFVPLFNEKFMSVEPSYPIHLLVNADVINENAKDSVTISILTHLIDRLGKSLKTEGHLITKEKLDNAFDLTDRLVIKKFEELSGIRFDHSKFRTREMFQDYIKRMMKD